MILIFILGLTVITVISSASAADNDVIYVNGSSGDDSWDELTWLTAKLTIKNATATVNDGGTVYIADGTYSGDENTNITLDKDVTFIGEHQNQTILNGTDTNRLFVIENWANVSLINLTLANGYIDESMGAAVFNLGNLTVTGCTFTANMAEYGSAIFNANTLYVDNSIFNGNLGLSISSIFNDEDATAQVRNSVFTANGVDGDAGAIGNNGDLTLTGCTFTSNSASSAGAVMNTGTMNITGCTFNGNNATNEVGGAILNTGLLNINDSTFTGNTADDDGEAGGAIFNEGGTINIKNSTFTSNTADLSGGAIYSYNEGVLNIADSVFSSNYAQAGGALVNRGNSTITNTIFDSNRAEDGGAIINNQNMTITSSTFTGNQADMFGGAISNRHNLTVHFSRLVGNTPVDIYNSEATLDAEYNWWGTNFAGSDPVTAGRVSGATISRWLVLNLNPDPATINSKGTSTVTVDLLHDQLGNYYDPAYGHVPDGIVVDLTGTLGSLNPARLSLTSGRATSLFTASGVGSALITATLDNQTSSTRVTINAAGENTTNPTVNAATVEMQKTGTSPVGLILALLSIFSGAVLGRRKL
ncbi:adhesin-like protein [Methanobacterium formicicum]|uniref:Adhesin-like protein n=1 Tax=Methanobacterium formicicum TaxID=2162 RepID=A0A089ZFP1_METFO|nr:right-handed parallel beta-helix repeat-containing protein [Methanobacterium formicicum]AIS31800.1 adhesin-like protein [Methanobacterium formicicum]